MRERRARAGAVAALLWVFAVVAAYYTVHKPFTVENLKAMLNVAADLMLAATGVLVATGLGLKALRVLGIEIADGLERGLVGGTLGLGLMGYPLLLFGAVGMLYQAVAYLLLIIGAFLVRREIVWVLHGCRKAIMRGRERLRWPGCSVMLSVAFVALTAGLALLRALLPATAWDAHTYHLAGPRLYLLYHRIVADPDNFYLNWPSQMEMLFLWGLLLKGEVLAQLWHWSLWAFSLGLVFILGRRAGGVRMGWWGVVLWAAVPSAVEWAAWAYNDLAVVAFVLLAVWAVQRWQVERRRCWLLLAGLGWGLATATKYTASLVAVLWVALIIWLDITQGRWRSLWADLGVLVGSAVLAFAPWAVKNTLVTGNPIYPFLFGGAGWNAVREAWMNWSGWPYSTRWWDYLLLPWHITVSGVAGSASFDATIGPLLLVLVPLALLMSRRPRLVDEVLVLGAVQVAVFGVLVWQNVYLLQMRLILSFFPLWALVAGYVLTRLREWDVPAFSISWIISWAVALVLALTLGTQTLEVITERPLGVLTGIEAREDYLLRRLGAYQELVEWVNERPAEERVLLLLEPRGYGCLPQCRADLSLDRLAQLRSRYGNAETVRRALMAEGYCYVALNLSGYRFVTGPESLYPVTAEDQALVAEMEAKWSAVAEIGGIYRVYDLGSGRPHE